MVIPRSNYLIRSRWTRPTCLTPLWSKNLSSSPSSTGLNPNSIFVISIPITTKKSYVYCNHKPSILSPSQTNKYPLVTKAENKLIAAAAKLWNKISTSKSTVNVKITNFAKRILDSVAYEENCLRSFPSKNSMIREINQSDSKEKADSKFIQNYINELKIPSDQIKPVLLYHPEFQSKSTILNQLTELKQSSYAKHYKYSIICGIGVPISLPFALLPVIPNIPGFYLAYRFYCNIKALGGIGNLDYLLSDQDIDSDKNSVGSHLKFQSIPSIDSSFELDNNIDDLKVDSVQEDERVILSKQIIDDLTTKLQLPQLTEELKRALRQETNRLQKDLKINDAVE